MQRIREIKPKKAILTHIEEVEVNAWGEKYLEEMKKKYSDVSFDYAYDGLEILV